MVEAEHVCRELLRQLDDAMSPTSLRRAAARGLGELGYQRLARERLLTQGAKGDTSAVLDQLYWSARYQGTTSARYQDQDNREENS